MRRLLLLAAALVAILWMASARSGVAAAEPVLVAAGAAPCGWADDRPGTGDSDVPWLAVSRTQGAVTESIWKSAPIHAGLAATRCPHLFDRLCPQSAPDPPRPPLASYLRHTPLLI